MVWQPFDMKKLVALLIAIALAPRVGLAGEPKPATAVPASASDAIPDDKPPEDPAAGKNKPEAMPRKAPKANAHQLIEALGAVVDKVVGAVAPDPPDPFEQQFTPQFRQLLNTEVHFVRTVCQPTREQYETIKSAGDVSLKGTVKKFAGLQRKMNEGIRAGQQPQWPDPRRLIADDLARSVQQTLSAEQAKRYQVELEKRAAARKRVALINLVVKLDKDLVLSAEQRNQLTERLNANWMDVWGQQLEVFLYGDQFLPVLPDDQVLPILNERQKEIWKGTPKSQNTIGGWFGFGFVQAVDIDEELLKDVTPVDEKKKEEQP